MENNNQQQEVKKPRRWRMFIIGFVASSIIFASFLSWRTYEQGLIDEENRRKWAELESYRADSTYKAEKKIKEYKMMVKAIARRDSVYSSLKYKIGDIVFLKPDSLKGVVQDITCDDQMDCFTYHVLYRDKNGDYQVLQKSVKLIY
jgi:hypothetical protein